MVAVVGAFVDPASAAPGDLDPGFGAGGSVATSFAVSADDVAIQSDGKLVAAGYDTVPGNKSVFALARFNPNGQLDSTFGGDGTVTTDLGCTPGHIIEVGAKAQAVVIQRVDAPSGSAEKALVAGRRDCWVGENPNSWVLARYDSDGTLDLTFGLAGVAELPFGGFSIEGIWDLAIDALGRIIAVGRTYPGATSNDSYFGVARLLPNGSPDPSFGDGGFTVTSFPKKGAVARTVAVTTKSVGGFDTEMIVAAGYAAGGNIALARYLPSGAPDVTFGANGVVMVQKAEVYDGALDIAVDSDGRLVVAAAAALARFTSTGALDASFGNAGFTAVESYSSKDGFYKTGVAIQTDGAIVAGGYQHPDGETRRFAVARYLSDGTRDPSFAAGGVATTVIGGTFSQAHALVLQPDGMIVMAGGYRFKLARYQTAGPPPTVPDAPVLTATAADRSVRLSWTTPANGGAPISGYRLYRGTATGSEVLLKTVGKVNVYDDTTVSNGTRYFYRVSAVNSVGEGALSNEVSALPATVPAAPSLTAATGKPKGVALSWTTAPNGGSPITGYRIYRGTASGSETFLKAVGTVTSYNDTATTKGTTYFYVVRAVNSVGEGAASNEVSARAS